ncbi:MAG: ABC transporter ATP-binding protein [Puniceicoccales bacterium]|jgi:putative ABC transport system ATP-binding protein|nr:ABC transporter ATP-binding protein [Puniceicoccales bacterium]
MTKPVTNAAAGSSLVTIKDLRKTYIMGDEQVHALDGVDLTIDRGEFLAVLGPSGSGKSTLMHILGFMDKATSGKISFEGEDVSRISASRRAWYRANRVGFIFQAFNLLPRLSVLENVLLPMRYSRSKIHDAKARAEQAIARVDMTHRIHHRPSQLSGGERQRVAIARSIVNQPGIILADEPTGNLDSKNVGRILDLLDSLLVEGLTVIMVTHDLGVADHARRIISMRDGKVQEDRRR